MQRYLLPFILLLLPLSLCAQATTWVEGRVFHDKNQNKTFDHGEKGLKQIAVSNGRDIVQTDSKGYFRIAVPAGHSIFPIIPTGYTFARHKEEQVNNTFFCYPEHNATADTTIRQDFGLIAEKQRSTFRIGAIGDIQVGNPEEMNYAGKSIFRELAGRRDIDFHIILGDLVNDQPDLLPPFRDMLNSLPAPSWTVLGNHDRNIENTAHLDDRF
ncbi:MAG TPA: metallophosphoesterase, partial [Sphingobacterium sp.]|nr:metallophosphoesterase [Sphingobacterium sp.]